MIADASHVDRSRAEPVAHLPEGLSRHHAGILAICDAVMAAAVSLIVFSQEPAGVADALVTAAIVCAVFWQAGLYRRSYALSAHDEAYYTCAVTAMAAPIVLLVICGMGQVGFSTVLVALALCALATSVVHLRFHMARRAVGVPSGGISTITPRAWHDRESAGYRLSKRIFDATIAAVALLLLAPVMLLCAAAVAIESGRPVLFTQNRVGENCTAFRIFKFRTMRSDADGSWARPGDQRITKVGALLRRTSLDELPQLFNVLRGDMALVGPRPEMVSFAKKFSTTIQNYDQRHVVAPGVTGWAQVYLKRNLQPDDVPDVLPYDLFYVEHASRLLDSVLILKTVVEVLFHRAV